MEEDGEYRMWRAAIIHKIDQLGPIAYDGDILRRLEIDMEISCSVAMVYVTLKRSEREGLIESIGRGQREGVRFSSKLWQLTPKGHEFLQILPEYREVLGEIRREEIANGTLELSGEEVDKMALDLKVEDEVNPYVRK